MTSNPVKFNQAAFLTSAANLSQCPPEVGAEVAFAGRSNAGKSSAINRLTGNGKLARTSKTPGRTQLINFFTLGHEHIRLVDLPGYGYAKVPLSVKLQWQAHLSEYLQERATLRGVVLLMDIRHPLQEFDRFMLDWSVESQMPVHILLTKADKLKRGPAKATLCFERHLRLTRPARRFDPLLQVLQHTDSLRSEAGISCQTFSATSGEGLSQLESQLSQWLNAADSAVDPVAADQPTL